MQLPNLVTVSADNGELLTQLANTAGDAALERLWLREMLAGFPATSEGSDRERFLARAMLLNQLITAAPYGAVHCTGDGEGLLVAYQQSELNGNTWDQMAKDASANLISSVFSDEESDAYEAQLKRMEAVTVRDWVLREEAPGDFLHLVTCLVNREKQGSGEFREMVEALLAYADAAQLPVFAEVYSDAMEDALEMLGFKTVHVFKDANVALTERCMRRNPQAA